MKPRGQDAGILLRGRQRKRGELCSSPRREIRRILPSGRPVLVARCAGRGGRGDAAAVRGGVGLGVVGQLGVGRMFRRGIRPGVEFDLLGLQTAAIFKISADGHAALLGVIVLGNGQIDHQRIAAMRIGQDHIERIGAEGAEGGAIEMVGVERAFSASAGSHLRMVKMFGFGNFRL